MQACTFVITYACSEFLASTTLEFLLLTQTSTGMRLAAIFVGLLSSIITWGQINNPVVLKWKLSRNEILTYKTLLNTIDTAKSQDLSIDLGALVNTAGDSIKATQINRLSKILSELNKAVTEDPLITNLTVNNKGIIDITMLRKKKADKLSHDKDTAGIKNSSPDLSKMVTDQVVLRGAIYDNGSIESFYVKSDQKNLIAVFFELPNKRVKINDSWSLEVNLITTDQNFKCDTAFRKNHVTLIDLKKVGNETIAVLKYDIMEFVSGDFNNPLSRISNETTMRIK